MGAIGLIFFLPALVAGVASQEDSEFLRHIHANHLSNHEQFGSGRFRFEVVQEFGGPSANLVKGQGRYVFDETNALYECHYDDRDVLANSEKNVDGSVQTSFQSRRLLRNGRSTLIDMLTPDVDAKSVFRTAEIFDDEDGSRFMGWVSFPLSIGCRHKLEPRLCRDINKVFTGELTLQDMTVDRSSEEHPTAKFTLKHKFLNRSYTLDISRGCMPIEARDFKHDGSTVAVTSLEDLVFLEGGGWLPRRMTVDKPTSREKTTVTVVSSEVSPKPSRADFRLEFTPPESVLDPSTSTSYDNCKSFSFFERPKVNDGARRVVIPKMASVGPSTDLNMPGERPQTPWLGYIGAVIAVSIACALATFTIRRKRSRISGLRGGR